MLKHQLVFLFVSTLLTVYSSQVAVASECPVINGRFYKYSTKDGQEFRQISPVYTRVADGVISYRFRSADDAVYHPADGKWRTVIVGAVVNQVKVTCASKNIRFEIQDQQERYHYWKSYHIVDERHISIDTNMGNVIGIFVKE